MTRKPFDMTLLIALVKGNPNFTDDVGAGWVLYQINDGYTVKYSECSDTKKAVVDELVKDEILAVTDDTVDFSNKFVAFMESRNV